MASLQHLFERNREWAKQIEADNPDFFSELEHQQSPEYLWIGCSDSRVPANQIIDLAPGEIFVHRNIANVVVHSDLNALSVIQYAVDVLKVKHIMVVGHYGCGGVMAALNDSRLGLATNWLRHVRDVYEDHRDQVDALSPEMQHRRLCELNVIAQVINTCQTTIVKDAWARGQGLTIHGWVYDLADGLLRDLDVSVSEPSELLPKSQASILGLAKLKS
ncbi:carbonate dehydratase [Ferrimonas balearica]|uniref:carbonate dehydratase n=1 Tax=Ferrimonas balearica TaxID=44012 RepID=UPI001C9A1D60|nr:carbonate dehydratase [Ferrimonas balearica]MBY5920724.1 carbonate dehydratase [Ferrimonas balearica]MBY5996591.1 carbonate dehydratase [Ferrimonas balearica]